MAKTIDDFLEYVKEREERINKNPFLRVRRFVRRKLYRFSNFRADVRSAYERARYGWSHMDFLGWGFDKKGMRYLGEAMIELGKVAHSAPNEYLEKHGRPQGFDQWANDLASYGCDLINGGKEEPLPDNYNDMTYNERADWLQESMKRETARQERATIAMHWVADHVYDLWD